MRLVWVVILLVLIGITILHPTQNAWACSCAPTSNLEYYDNSDFAFVGTVTKSEESMFEIENIRYKIYLDYLQKNNSSDLTNIPPKHVFTKSTLVTFDIDSEWKGNLNDSIALDANTNSSCGYGFQNNTTYLVFANDKVDGYSSTGSCMGNQKISDDSEPSFIQYVFLGYVQYLFFPFWKLITIISISAIIITIILVSRKFNFMKISS